MVTDQRVELRLVRGSIVITGQRCPGEALVMEQLDTRLGQERKGPPDRQGVQQHPDPFGVGLAASLVQPGYPACQQRILGREPVGQGVIQPGYLHHEQHRLVIAGVESGGQAGLSPGDRTRGEEVSERVMQRRQPAVGIQPGEHAYALRQLQGSLGRGRVPAPRRQHSQLVQRGAEDRPPGVMISDTQAPVDQLGPRDAQRGQGDVVFG